VTMTRFNLFRDFVDLRDSVDRLFQETFGPTDRLLPWAPTTRMIPLEVYETPDEVVVRALVPGIAPESIDLQYQQGMLTLRASAATPEPGSDWTWHIQEFGYGDMVRRITLPKAVDVDQARTHFEHGILTLTLPKVAEARPKQIRVVPQPQIASGTTSA
jgi:HSP20 family protein